MKVVVSSTGSTLDSEMDPRFGRCSTFLLVDTETMEHQVIPNTSESSAHGAGIGAAQTVARLGAKAVITGHVGPNAHMALSGANVDIYTVPKGTVKDGIEKLMKGELVKTSNPTVGGHFGQGGRGRRG
jgi:predicted Fe-Mo cluster-binding NifX family protein